MEDITVIKLTSGIEIIGRQRQGTPVGYLEDALNVLVRQTEDGRVHFGLGPITASIAPAPGSVGHCVEIPTGDILTYGPPVKEIEGLYRQVTSRIEVARVVPMGVKRGGK